VGFIIGWYCSFIENKMSDEHIIVQRRLRLLASHLMPPIPREDALLCHYKIGPGKEPDDKLVILNATKGKIGEVKDEATQKAMDTKEAIVNKASVIKKKVEDSVEQGKEYLQSAGNKFVQMKDTAVDKATGAKDSTQYLARNIRKKVVGETKDESNNSIKDTEKGQETSKGFLKNQGDKAAEKTAKTDGEKTAKTEREKIAVRIEDIAEQMREQMYKVVNAMENSFKKA